MWRHCAFGRALIASIIREWIMPFVSSHWIVLKNGDPKLFGATCNFNDQILPYSILFLTFINTNVFYLMSFNFHANLLRPWRFPLTTKCPWKTLPNFRCDTWDIHFSEALCTCGRESNLMNRHLRNKSWKPECVGSFNMGWRIEYTNIRQPMLKLKTHSGFHDLFRFWYV